MYNTQRRELYKCFCVEDTAIGTEMVIPFENTYGKCTYENGNPVFGSSFFPVKVWDFVPPCLGGVVFNSPGYQDGVGSIPVEVRNFVK